MLHKVASDRIGASSVRGTAQCPRWVCTNASRLEAVIARTVVEYVFGCWLVIASMVILLVIR
jgi:hypothetical protein